MSDAPGVAQALAACVRAVKDGSFPDDQLHAW
jgi:3-methyl-2-oxobutanoate hydroxymethyltransferase